VVSHVEAVHRDQRGVGVVDPRVVVARRLGVGIAEDLPAEIAVDPGPVLEEHGTVGDLVIPGQGHVVPGRDVVALARPGGRPVGDPVHLRFAVIRSSSRQGRCEQYCSTQQKHMTFHRFQFPFAG
jgi:hypothetical protein